MLQPQKGMHGGNIQQPLFSQHQCVFSMYVLPDVFAQLHIVASPTRDVWISVIKRLQRHAGNPGRKANFPKSDLEKSPKSGAWHDLPQRPAPTTSLSNPNFTYEIGRKEIKNVELRETVQSSPWRGLGLSRSPLAYPFCFILAMYF